MTSYGTIPTSSSPSTTEPEDMPRAKERPWKQMFDHHQIRMPSSLQDSIERLKKNVTYFAMNYVTISLMILFLSIIWHPISIFAFFTIEYMMLLFYYSHRHGPFVVLNYTIDHRVVIIVLSFLFLVLLFFTSATWDIIWSVFVSGLVVTAHAVFRKVDDLSFDEETGGAFYNGIPSSSTSSLFFLNLGDLYGSTFLDGD